MYKTYNLRKLERNTTVVRLKSESEAQTLCNKLIEVTGDTAYYIQTEIRTHNFGETKCIKVVYVDGKFQSFLEDFNCLNKVLINRNKIEIYVNRSFFMEFLESLNEINKQVATYCNVVMENNELSRVLQIALEPYLR